MGGRRRRSVRRRQGRPSACARCLAWLLSRGPHVIALPGTTSIAHLEQDVAAAGMTLDPALLAQVDTLFGPGAIRCPRYAATMQAQIDTETFPDEELA